MIFTDGVHLISSISESDLHAFAKSINLKREWYQDRNKHPHPHYDLTTDRALRRAIKAGAKKISARELIKILNV